MNQTALPDGDAAGTENQEATAVAAGIRLSATRRSRGRRKFSGIPAFLFIVPSLVLIATFFIAPFVFNTGFAFVSWTSFSDRISWDGLDNFRYIWDLGVLGQAIKVTAIYAVVVMIVQNIVSLTLAVGLQRTSAANSVFRTIFFVPV